MPAPALAAMVGPARPSSPPERRLDAPPHGRQRRKERKAQKRLEKAAARRGEAAPVAPPEETALGAKERRRREKEQARAAAEQERAEEEARERTRRDAEKRRRSELRREKEAAERAEAEARRRRAEEAERRETAARAEREAEERRERRRVELYRAAVAAANDYCEAYWEVPLRPGPRGAIETTGPGAEAARLAVDDRALLAAMEAYRAEVGEYPYVEDLHLARRAFAKYLRRSGIRPEIYGDLRKIITACIEWGRPAVWAPLRRALLAAGHEFADTELFIADIGVGGARVLTEASELGWADPRLEHAVVTLQRLWRYGRLLPRAPGEPKAAWLAGFEREHHDPGAGGRAAWRAQLIHLRSMAEFDPLRVRAEEHEYAVLRWNRRVVPELFAHLARHRNGAARPHEAHLLPYEVSGAYAYLEQMCPPEFEQALVRKRAALYERYLEYLLDDDALAKLSMLTRLRAEGALRAWRHPKRDVLKFISFRLNEPPPRGGAVLVRDTPVARCYVERLDSLPLFALEEVLRAAPKHLAPVGRDLLTRFAGVDLAALEAEGVRAWFLLLCVDDLAAVAAAAAPRGDARASAADLEALLRRRALPPRERAAALAALREQLEAAQKRVRDGRPLYDYSVWVEPVTVTGVVAARPDEAALGEGRSAARAAGLVPHRAA